MSHGTKRTFTYPDDLSRFPSSTQEILLLANELGWETRWLGVSHDLACIVSPNREKTLNIPRTNINANRTRSWLAGIKRYSGDAAFDAAIEKRTASRGTMRLVMRDEPPTPVARPRPPVPETTVAAAMREAEEKAKVEPRVTVEPEPAPSSGHGDVISEKPWMVRRGGVKGGHGRMYESPAVIERTHADGSVDYRCKFCDFTHENPRSVSSHRSQSHKDEVSPTKTLLHVEEYEPTDIVRPRSAIRRLRSDLLHALDTIEGWREMDADALAEAVAEAVYEARPDRPVAEPLTTEQVLARITMLVDGGRLASMHQEVERMREALAEAQSARTAAEAEAERLHEERRVLRDLLAEEQAGGS